MPERGEFHGPLVLGSLRGRRSFDITEDGRLTGLTFRQIWRTGENLAKCYPVPWASRGVNLAEEHDVMRCRCGFYAYYDADDYSTESRASAVIEGYGRTVRGTRGFRAQKARILALCLPPARAPYDPRGWRRGRTDNEWVWSGIAVLNALGIVQGYRTAAYEFFGTFSGAVGALLIVFNAFCLALMLREVRDIRRAHRVANGGPVPKTFSGSVAASRLSYRQQRAAASRPDLDTDLTRLYLQMLGHYERPTAEMLAKVRAKYPDVPIYDDVDAMLRDFPTGEHVEQ